MGPLFPLLERWIRMRSLSCFRLAVYQWDAAFPRTEEPLMHRLVAPYLARPDAVVRLPWWGRVRVQSDVHELHRKGPRLTDRFGADLAISLVVRGRSFGNPVFAKTLFVQTKLADGGTLRLRREQLEQSMVSNEIADRSVVLAVDRGTREGWIIDVRDAYARFPSGQQSLGFHYRAWLSFEQYIQQWLWCRRGRPEVPGGFYIRGLLRDLAEAVRDGRSVDGVLDRLPRSDFTQGRRPSSIAKSWLQLRLDLLEPEDDA